MSGCTGGSGGEVRRGVPGEVGLEAGDLHFHAVAQFGDGLGEVGHFLFEPYKQVGRHDHGKAVLQDELKQFPEFRRSSVHCITSTKKKRGEGPAS